MTHQVKRILSKLYKWENRSYNEEGEAIYAEEVLSEKEKKILSDYGWKTNEIVHFSGHDDTLEKLHSLKNNSALTKERCIADFVAGVGGSYLRGISVLEAWHVLNTLPPHSYKERPEYRCCWICGEVDKTWIINDSEYQYCAYSGCYAGSSPRYAYLNLKHLIDVPPVIPSEEDIENFSKFLAFVRSVPDDETPGRFEKHLRAAKIIKGHDGTRRGLMHALAMVGVIPNQFISLSDKTWTSYGDIAVCEEKLKNMRGRSDLEMPWAGWNGALKLNEERLEELFGEYLRL